MPTLADMITRAGTLRPTDSEVLHRLVSDWQLIGDVAFGDLLLVVPGSNKSLLVVAHRRPDTASAAYREDMVGVDIPASVQPLLHQCLQDGKRRHLNYNKKNLELVPVKSGERYLAVLVLAQLSQEHREPHSAKLSYDFVCESLLEMVANGDFPLDGAVTSVGHGTPRVADGFIQIDENGVVQYLSPNAVSALRRLGADGQLLGNVLGQTITQLAPDKIDETLAVVVMGKAPWITEISARGATTAMRAIPLMRGTNRIGAALLCRDITEIRRHEEDILTKNATIREIHHRVKNNLQTVSALLRLQSRRSDSPEVKQTLAEAGRRVATIALVHETLSQTVEELVAFDEVFERLLRMAADVASPNQRVKTNLQGTFGRIPGVVATPLAIVLNELVTNAVEHGLEERSGTVEVKVAREGVSLRIEVHDDGSGIDTDRIHSGLGTQIVSTMVRSELHGSIEWMPRPGGGTSVFVIARLDLHGSKP